MKKARPQRLLGLLAGFLLLGLIVAPGVSAQVPWKDADFEGSAAGIALHADAVQTGPEGPGRTRVANVDEGVASAAVDSLGLTPALETEMQTIVQPALPNHNSYGRGSGLEVALLRSTPVITADALLSGRAEASAPPSTNLITRETQLLNNPSITASLLRGQAQARWNEDDCILGEDISYGTGLAADVNIANNGVATSLGNPQTPQNPQRFAVSSVTRTRLVPQVNVTGTVVGENFGLMTEVRQTYAPITLLNGTRIEILGEWVLRAVALGVPGSYIHYGPRNVSPETPVIRILDANGNPTTNITTQGLALLGPTGLVVDIPAQSGQVAIGEDPRAIATPPGAPPIATSRPTVTDTEVSGAVDVVRALLQIQAANLQIEDIRIGHMEVKSRVPEGGIICNLRVLKRSEPEVVRAGDEFTYVITVQNPFDCILTNVKVVDTITTTRGIRYEILSQDPPANDVAGNVITWNDVGPIQPKGSKELRVRIHVLPTSAAGEFRNHVLVTSNCGIADAQGRVGVGVPVRGEVVIDFPKVIRGPLPLTGGPERMLMIASVSMAVLAVPTLLVARRLRRSPQKT